MNSQEEEALEFAKKGVEQLFEPVKDVVRRLLGPAATEIGLAWGDSARVWRLKHAVRLLEEVQTIARRSGFQLKAVRPAVLFPILDAASLEDDPELQHRWAALLANAASVLGDEVRAFPEILRQLTSTEAKFLDRAFDETLEDHERRIKELSTGSPTLDGANSIPVRVREETSATMTAVQVGNLERLGLIRADRSAGYGDPVIYLFRMTDPLYLSPLAKALVRACRPPMDVRAEQ